MNFRTSTLLLIIALLSCSLINIQATKCTRASRRGRGCPRIYKPVCGYNPHIQCIKAPCPNYVTYSNSCEACHNRNVLSYTEGACKDQPTQCTKASRLGPGCPKIYKPVCGYNPHIQCIKAPCPNYVTYSNSCEACHNRDVVSYTEGACKGEPVKPGQCTYESRLGDVCPQIYKPVCAYNPHIQCIKAPCPSSMTYSNSCEACHDQDVVSYTEGACEDQPLQCTNESRYGDICPAIYDPVCGYRPGVRCVTTPCTYVNYSNSCEACHDSTVLSYTKGECTIDA